MYLQKRRRSHTITWLSGLILLCALATGCLVGPDDGTEKSQTNTFAKKTANLFPLTTTLWSSTNIKVCWENTPANQSQERAWVKSAILGTWEKYTSVRFVGWGKCQSSGEHIRITVADQGAATLGLGNQMENVTRGMVLNFTFNNWRTGCAAAANREACIRNIAVHEFGHALGLAHEHNRGDTPTTCTASPQGSQGDQTIGPWDLNSVMNYCNPVNENGGALSVTDTFGTQSLYGPRWLLSDAGDFSGTAGLAAINSFVFAVRGNRLYRLSPTAGEIKTLGGAVWDGSYAMTALGTTLYIVQGTRLWSVNASSGARTQVGTDDWSGADAITSLGSNLYIARGGTVWRVNPSTGTRTSLSSNWANTNAMIAYNNKLYLQWGRFLWTMDPNNGNFSRLGNSDWTGSTAMAVANNKLYVQQHAGIFAVDPNNGTWSTLTTSLWRHTTAMIAINNTLFMQANYYIWRVETSPYSYSIVHRDYNWSGTTAIGADTATVYVVKGNDLFKVNKDTGVRTFLSDTWNNTKHLVYNNGWLYAQQGNSLYRISPGNGSWTRLGNETWTNTTAMAALNTELFVIRGDDLRKVNVTTGVSTKLSGSWNNSRSMVGLNGNLYVLQYSSIYRANSTNGAWTNFSSGQWTDFNALSTNGTALFAGSTSQVFRRITVNPGQSNDGTFLTMGSQTWAGFAKMASAGNLLFIVNGNGMFKADLR